MAMLTMKPSLSPLLLALLPLLATAHPADDLDGQSKITRLPAVQATADALGNTPAVARSSYIDPRVFTRFARGETLDLGIAPESAIRILLGRH